MKKLNRWMGCLVLLYLAVTLVVNGMVFRSYEDGQRKHYTISVNRTICAIEQYETDYGKAALDTKAILKADPYHIVKKIVVSTDTDSPQADYFSFDREYVIHKTKKAYYKICYEQTNEKNGMLYFGVNLANTFFFAAVFSFLLFLKKSVLEPFFRFEMLPYELSKGNLLIPIKENKNRYFGKYLWGMELLREKLERDKEKEQAQTKEKKMLLLSLSHDIKTPLSAIRLYAVALSRNLYKTEEKRKKIAENIGEKVTEIETYISDIVKSSNEDFLHYDVENAEIYTNDVFAEIGEYYREKMELEQIDFFVPMEKNCIVKADRARLVEVIQNIVENAMKYGDGRRIWIECDHDTEEYVILIKNTGCMLEQKELSHIFDSFFRGSNVENKAGSGLGLYICRTLVHRMDGEILASIKEWDKERIMELKISLRLC